MMKLILFITALHALVCSNKEATALECYECKTPDYPSSYPRFHALPICDKDIEKSNKRKITSVDFAACIKIKEKVKVSDKEETLIIRTYETSNEKLNLNETIFYGRYDCKPDLCNTGSYPVPAWLTLLLSIPVVISLNI